MSELTNNFAFDVDAVVFNPVDENVQAEAGGSAAPRLPSFTAVAYTGGAMVPQNFPHPVAIDLDGIKLRSKQVPIRLFHDREQGLGHAVRAKPVDGAFVIEGVFSRDTPQAKEVVASALNGYPWQLSVGGRAIRKEWIEPGVSVKVNGKTLRGPLEHIFEFELAEVSFCDVAADSKTFAEVRATLNEGDSMSNTINEQNDAAAQVDATQDVRQDQVDAAKADDKASAPPFLKKEDDENKKKAEEDAKKKEEDEAKKKAEDDAKKETKANADAQDVQAAAFPAPVVNVNAASPFDSELLAKQLQANANRIASINSIEASGHEDLRAQAIDENWSLDDFKTALVKARHETGYQAASQIPTALVAGTNMQKKQTCDVVEAAIVTACLGDQFAQKHYDEETLNRAYDSKRKLGGFRDVFAFSTDAACYASDLNDMNYIESAFTTSGLDRVFRNVVNNAMLSGYETVDESWRKLCSISRAQDFKPIYNYRTSGNFTFERLAANGGTIENAEFSEQEYTNRVHSYALKYSLTREMLYNDDLNALVQFPTKLGMGAAERLNDEVWKCILAANQDENGDNFFSTAHRNYLKYTSEDNVELSFDSLNRASNLFEEQVTPQGRPIAQIAKYLVVPTALRQTAWRLLNSVTLNESTAIGIPQGVANPYASQYQYEIVASPYLQSKMKGFENGSKKSWYLFGDPNRISAFDVVFLNGQERPTIEQGQASFDQLGVQYRGYFDFGVNAQDYCGAVYVDCRED